MKSSKLELIHVTKEYLAGNEKCIALKEIDTTFLSGEFVSIVGKSGSGKSTLLNMLTGIDRPSGGEILYNGVALQTKSEEELTEWRSKNVGIVFQFFQLIPTLTTIENVMLPMDFKGGKSLREMRKSAKELLDLVDIADCADKYPSEMSGGQQQRIAIARALANQPEFIIADEPTGNLDTQTANKIMELFIRLKGLGTGIIMVTHNEELAEIADRNIRIKDGLIIADHQNIKKRVSG